MPRPLLHTHIFLISTLKRLSYYAKSRYKGRVLTVDTAS